MDLGKQNCSLVEDWPQQRLLLWLICCHVVVLIHIVGLTDIHISSLVHFFFFCVYCNSLGFVFSESISYVFREVHLLKWPVTINKFVLLNKTTAQDSVYVGLSSN